MDARTELRRVQSTRYSKNGVSKRLGIQAAGRVVMQQLIPRVDSNCLFVGKTRLPKRSAQNNAANKPFDGPAVAGEAGCHKVEQLRMRRLFSHTAKIVRRGHDASTEHVMPDTIDHNTRRQRITGTGDELCKFTPTASPCFKRLRRIGNDFDVPRRHDRHPLQRITALENRKAFAVALIGQAGNHSRLRYLRFELAILFQQFADLVIALS